MAHPDDQFDWPVGGGGMGTLIRDFDWATTPLGPIAAWPQSLRTAVELLLTSGFPTALALGPEAIMLYNDGYRAIIGDRHPLALGASTFDIFPELRPQFAPVLQRVWQGETVTFADESYSFARHAGDAPEETWLTLTYSPLRDEAGQVVGVYTVIIETTARVLADRRRDETEAALRAIEARQAFLIEMTDTLRPLRDASDIEREATRLLGEALGTNQVFYAAIEADGDTGVIRSDYVHGVPSGVGRYSISAFASAFVPDWRAGRTTVTPDVAVDPRFTDAERAAYASVSSRAAVAVPLVKGGQLVALLGLNHATPRAWTDEDVTLAEAVAERTWAAVERARAEAALREREGQLRAIYDGTREYIGLLTPDGTLHRANRASLEFGGNNEEEVINKPFWETVWFSNTPGMPEAVRQGIEVAAKGEFFRTEMTLARPTGELRTFDFSLHPIRSERGEVILIVPEGRDITEIKRAEAALRESEARQQLALDAAQMGTFTWHVQEDRGEPDAQMLALFGQPPDSTLTLATTLATLIHPDDRERYATAVAEATDPAGKGVLREDIRILLSDGAEHWLAITGQTFFEGEPPHATRMAGTALDITARKATEAALRASETRLASALADAQTLQRLSARLLPERRPEALYTPILAAARALMRSDAASLQLLEPDGKRLQLLAWHHFHPESADFWRWVDASSTSSCGEALRTNTRIVVPDIEQSDFMAGTQDLVEYRRSRLRSMQSTPLLSRSGRLLGMLSTHWRVVHQPAADAFGQFDLLARQVADLLERTLAEAALRESEARFRAFGAASSDLLWIRDAATLRFEYLSPAFAGLYGTDSALVQGGNDMAGWIALIHPEDRERTLANIEMVRAGARVTHEFRVVRPADGSVRWLRDTDFPLTDETGRITRIGGIAQEITEERETLTTLEARVAERTTALRSLSRQLLVVREDEQRNLSRELHDQIGQLLTGLRLTLATTRRGNEIAGDGVFTHAEAIIDDLQGRVRALVLDLRPPALDDLGLLPALEDHFQRYTTQTGVRVELRQLDLARRLPSAVETAVYRIVQEALTNVARHAGTDTAIVQLIADGSWMTVQVRDTGEGFDPDAALATSASAGLAGMRERATLLGGTLTIDATPGAGTVVTAELPLDDPGAPIIEEG